MPDPESATEIRDAQFPAEGVTTLGGECEPTWTCRPSTSSPRSSASATAARASSGGRPNFDP
jgi:hypothetical protein